MKYVNKDDLVTFIQETLLDQSLVELNVEDDKILSDIESSAIDLVIAYISGRYDTSKIFGDSVMRNGVLVQVICMIVLYRAVRRNAARKVPGDYKDMYDDAIKILEKVQEGAMSLKNLPLITAPDGSAFHLVYGNNTNTDFYI